MGEPEEVDAMTWRAAQAILAPIDWRTCDGAMVAAAYRGDRTVIYVQRGGRYFLIPENGRLSLAECVRKVADGLRRNCYPTATPATRSIPA